LGRGSALAPSNFPETREGLGFSEIAHSRPQTLSFKPFKF